MNQSEIAIFIDASNGAAKIQNSIQQSIVNIDLDASNPTKKNVNIEQSAINIDIWLITNIFIDLVIFSLN